jgi:predicted nucleotidyltransferase
VPLLDAVAAHLRHRDVPHALIGAAALALHGVSRSTFDQDLLVVDERVLADSFWRDFEPGARVEIRRGDRDDPLAGVVRLQAGDERDVDLVVGRSGWQREMLDRAEPIVEGVGLAVVRAADLILLKLYAGGSQDRWDIEQLLALDQARTIRQEVERRLPALPDRSATLWRRLVADA